MTRRKQPPHPPTQAELDQYRWYHQFSFPNGAATRPTVDCPDVWAHIEATLMKPDYFQGRDVLDAGCRDCGWALKIETINARSVTAIDITLNPGVEKLVLPWFESGIEQRELNVMDLPQGAYYNTIFCAGLLYHLRYPFYALKLMSDVLRTNGLLLIETALLDRPEVEEMPMLWCPVHESPYEATSCTFFNARGLRVTMESLGFEELLASPMKRTLHNPPGMDRGTFVYRKREARNRYLDTYWNATASAAELDKLIAEAQP